MAIGGKKVRGSLRSSIGFRHSLLQLAIDILVGSALQEKRNPLCVVMESSLTMPESSASGRTLSNTPSLMETLPGLLRARVKRWMELAGHDVHSSDPYVVVKLGSPGSSSCSKQTSSIFCIKRIILDRVVSISYNYNHFVCPKRMQNMKT